MDGAAETGAKEKIIPSVSIITTSVSIDKAVHQE